MLIEFLGVYKNMEITTNKQLILKFYTTGENKYINDFDNFYQKYEVGNIIVSLLNSYNDIIQILDKYIRKIDKSTPLTLAELIKVFKNLIKNLETKKFYIISKLLEINFNKLCYRIENIEKYDLLADKEYNKFQGNILGTPEIYIRRRGFPNYAFKNFLLRFKRSFSNTKNIVEKNFNIDNNRDTNIPLKYELPKMFVEYIDNNLSYTYYITSITDLLLASTYNLHLSKKFILKCEYCGDLFIPKTNKKEQKYCYSKDEYGNYICRNKGRKNIWYRNKAQSNKSN